MTTYRKENPSIKLVTYSENIVYNMVVSHTLHW